MNHTSRIRRWAFSGKSNGHGGWIKRAWWGVVCGRCSRIEGMGSRWIEHFADQGKLAAVGGRQVGSAAENSLNFGQSAHRVNYRIRCQKGIKNRVGDGGVRPVGVNRYVCTRDQLRPKFGSGHVGALNDIGAEI